MVEPFERLCFALELLATDATRVGAVASAPGPSAFSTEFVRYTTVRPRWIDGRREECTLAVTFGAGGTRLELDGELVFAGSSADVFGGVLAAFRLAVRHLRMWAETAVVLGPSVFDASSPSPILCVERWTSGAHPITVRLHQPGLMPVPNPNYGWRCGFRIEGVAEGPSRHGGGVDPAGALIVAIRELALVWHQLRAPRARVMVRPPDCSWSGVSEPWSAARSAIRLGPFARAGRAGAWVCVASRDGFELPIGGVSPIACLIGALPIVLPG
ncbi:MAG: hypothetical protein ABMB14_16555 [Myxococcota bacterium]